MTLTCFLNRELTKSRATSIRTHTMKVTTADQFSWPVKIRRQYVITRCVNANKTAIKKKTKIIKKFGLVWESNPGPLTPEARIIPLDQQAKVGRVTNLRSCEDVHVCWQGCLLRVESENARHLSDKDSKGCSCCVATHKCIGKEESDESQFK